MNKHPLYGPAHTISFGKYQGRTLDQISDKDPSYLLWLADNKIMKIKPSFLDAVRRDEVESSVLMEYYHGDWGNRDLHY